MNGQYVPFEATELERRAMGDPRPSLEERYSTHEDYVGRVTIAAMDMAMPTQIVDTSGRMYCMVS